jgi:hypothetical protein
MVKIDEGRVEDIKVHNNLKEVLNIERPCQSFEPSIQYFYFKVESY